MASTARKPGINAMPAPKIAAFFDLDGTLLDQASARLFISYLRHRGLTWRYLHRRYLVPAIASLIGFKLGIVDMTRAIEHAARLATGADSGELWELVDQWFSEMVLPTIRAGGREQLAWHLDQGHVPVICSAASQYSVLPVAEHLGISHTIHTEWLTADGTLTGGLRLPVVYGTGKVYWATKWADSHNVDLGNSYFYTDHASDMPLLQAVGRPVAVDPEPQLRQLAAARRWPIVAW
jgi:HAD superfamily hydrolase (TIGR01490 family)